jgi:hypothetical protein
MVARVSSGKSPRRTSRLPQHPTVVVRIGHDQDQPVDRTCGELGVRTACLSLDVVEAGLGLAGDGDAVLARYGVPPPVVEWIHPDFDVPRPPGLEAAAVAQEQPHMARVAERRAAWVRSQPHVEPDHGRDSCQNAGRRLGYPPEFEPPDFPARDARAPAHRCLTETARNPRAPDLFRGET